MADDEPERLLKRARHLRASAQTVTDRGVISTLEETADELERMARSLRAAVEAQGLPSHAQQVLFKLSCASVACGSSFEEAVERLASRDSIACPNCGATLSLAVH